MLSKRLLARVKRKNKAVQVETTHMIDINTSQNQAASPNLLSKRPLDSVKSQNKPLQVETTHMIDINTSEK